MFDPNQLTKSGSEDGEQAALFCWAANQIAAGECLELEWMFAIANGGSRGSTKAHAMAVGSKLKATGVKKGVSDILLPVARHGCHGLFIEMKKSKANGGGVVSAEQKDFGQAMLDNGYGFCVCYGWDQARDVLTQYLAN